MNRTPALWVCLAAGMASAGLPVASQARLVDRILAVVNGEVIAFSDAHVYRSLFSPDRDMDSALEEMIDQKLLAAEARKFEIAPPSEEELEEEIQRVSESLGGPAALSGLLKRLAVADENFREMIGARLLVNSLLDQRIKSFVFVSHQEAEEYYEGHKDRFEGKAFDEIRPEIVDLLTRQKIEARKADYLERLRNRAGIQIN